MDLASLPKDQLMINALKRWLKPTRSRLSRRIVFYVFVSVVVIETIILIPSTMKREKELLQQMRSVAWAQIEVLMTLVPDTAGASQVFDQVRQLQGCSEIVGGTLYDLDGDRIGSFGEPPDISFSEVTAAGVQQAKSPDGRRIDMAWRQPQLKKANVLVLRQDATAVKRELEAFILRIAGLILIISIFVTVGAWSAIQPIVVTPILRLRKDLVLAGEAISNDRSTPDFYAASVHRLDELGDHLAGIHANIREPDFRNSAKISLARLCVGVDESPIQCEIGLSSLLSRTALQQVSQWCHDLRAILNEASVENNGPQESPDFRNLLGQRPIQDVLDFVWIRAYALFIDDKA